MNKIKLIVCTLIMCMSFAGVAEAKSRGGSFKSGFSSQKRSAPKPAPTYTAPAPQPQAKKTGFGSFGAADPKAQQNAAAVPQSKMSNDLNNTAAQSNAQKTADVRNNSTEKNAASESGWFRSGNQNSVPQKPQVAAPNGATENSNRGTFSNGNNGQRSNGLMYGLMGFMLGNSLAQHAGASNAQHENQVANVNANQTNDQILNGDNSTNANGIANQQEQNMPVVETESFFMKVVRVVLWIALISGVIWVVRKVMSFRSRNLKKATHYSLGS